MLFRFEKTGVLESMLGLRRRFHVLKEKVYMYFTYEMAQTSDNSCSGDELERYGLLFLSISSEF